MTRNLFWLKAGQSNHNFMNPELPTPYSLDIRRRHQRKGCVTGAYLLHGGDRSCAPLDGRVPLPDHHHMIRKYALGAVLLLPMFPAIAYWGRGSKCRSVSRSFLEAIQHQICIDARFWVLRASTGYVPVLSHGRFLGQSIWSLPLI